MKTRTQLEDAALKIHWSVEHGFLGEAVRILDELQQDKSNVPTEVVCRTCGHYLPGHATGSVDICGC